MVKTNKFFNIILLVAFIGTAVFGVLTIVPTIHHEPGCPFMAGEQSICPMGLLEHISAWKSAFSALIPTLLSLLIVSWFVFKFTRELNSLNPPNKFADARALRYSENFNLYEELFSNGILNPKAP